MQTAEDVLDLFIFRVHHIMVCAVIASWILDLIGLDLGCLGAPPLYHCLLSPLFKAFTISMHTAL